MGNDQLLPAGYNIHLCVCDEYIAVYDVKQYVFGYGLLRRFMENSSTEYMERSEYPVTDAGYGSFNNYLYCEEH